jgi:hypothetical protein
VAPLAMLGITVTWALVMLRQIPCLAGENNYENMCYTDISVLYYWRGLAEGQIPIIQAELEYPVLTAAMMEFVRRLLPLFGAKSEAGLPDDDVSYAAQTFFGINALLLFALMLVLIWAHLRMSRPRDALLIALSPAVVTAGLINWDALVIALTSLALLAWSKRRPVLAGVFIGLGIAAKLYPALLLVPLAMLCLRSSRWREFIDTTIAAVLSWVVVNLPYYLLNPTNWTQFWTFNSERGADLGSIWLVLDQLGQPAPDLSRVEALLMVVGAGALCALLLGAKHRPRLAQGCFLIVCWFLIINKVYSPQYVLWLLPLLVLADPRLVDWLLFGIAETLYFVSVWSYFVAVEAGAEYRFYWAAIIFRILVQLWLCIRVIWDIVQPWRDPVRKPIPAAGPDLGDLFDDRDGGVLDQAPDAAWLVTLRSRLLHAIRGRA